MDVTDQIVPENPVGAEAPSKPKRQSLGKKVRFEVFKRDSFTCQYCGEHAPNVVLQADHIDPVANGGSNDIVNLITACSSCNGGKGARLLDDNAAVEKQHRQMAELQERREQIEMMLEWKTALSDFDQEVLDAVLTVVHGHIPGYTVSASGRQNLKKLIKRFPLSDLLEAVERAAEVYIRFGVDDAVTADSASEFLNRIGGVCTNLHASEWSQRKHYIRGILKNRLDYFNVRRFYVLAEDLELAGVDVAIIEQHAKEVRSWTEFMERCAQETTDGQD